MLNYAGDSFCANYPTYNFILPILAEGPDMNVNVGELYQARRAYWCDYNKVSLLLGHSTALKYSKIQAFIVIEYALHSQLQFPIRCVGESVFEVCTNSRFKIL